MSTISEQKAQAGRLLENNSAYSLATRLLAVEKEKAIAEREYMRVCEQADKGVERIKELEREIEELRREVDEGRSYFFGPSYRTPGNSTEPLKRQQAQGDVVAYHDPRPSVDWGCRFLNPAGIDKEDNRRFFTVPLYAHPSAPAAVPEEWKMVPIEPSQEMLDAGYWPCTQGRGAKSAWGSMIAAAPAPAEPGPIAAPAAVPEAERLIVEDYCRALSLLGHDGDIHDDIPVVLAELVGELISDDTPAPAVVPDSVMERIKSLLLGVGHHGVIITDEGQEYEIGEQEVAESQELYGILSASPAEPDSEG